MTQRTVVTESFFDRGYLRYPGDVFMTAPAAEGMKFSEAAEHLVRIDANILTVEGRLTVGPGVILRARSIQAEGLRIGGAVFTLEADLGSLEVDAGAILDSAVDVNASCKTIHPHAIMLGARRSFADRMATRAFSLLTSGINSLDEFERCGNTVVEALGNIGWKVLKHGPGETVLCNPDAVYAPYRTLRLNRDQRHPEYRNRAFAALRALLHVEVAREQDSIPGLSFI